MLNFSESFKEDVIERFVAAYENGMTPNPCIDCNSYLKFDELYRRARELGYDYVVTGHYAHIEKDGSSGRYFLKKALDSDKDQSYVLYALTQEQLAHTQFPLGDMTKHEVRCILNHRGLSTNISMTVRIFVLSGTEVIRILLRGIPAINIRRGIS